MPQCWLLVPGFGAQGGDAKELVAAFDPQGLGAVINSSRDIIFAHSRDPYRQRYSETQWQHAVEAATRDAIEQLRAAGVVTQT
jgi:orotidine-5'-phosphate decarboxylase